MIIDGHPIFEEVHTAVQAMTSRCVIFNAHRANREEQLPPHSILYSLENLGTCQERILQSKVHEIWDFDQTNLQHYAADQNVRHVPLGFHPSMIRFSRASTFDVDVVFVGSLNERREHLLQNLRRKGYRVQILGGPHYGSSRDEIYARSRLALNLHYWTGPALFETVRVSHLLANQVPFVTETSDARTEEFWGITGIPYDRLEIEIEQKLARPQAELEKEAASKFEQFRQHPWILPSET